MERSGWKDVVDLIIEQFSIVKLTSIRDNEGAGGDRLCEEASTLTDLFQFKTMRNRMGRWSCRCRFHHRQVYFYSKG